MWRKEAEEDNVLRLCEQKRTCKQRVHCPFAHLCSVHEEGSGAANASIEKGMLRSLTANHTEISSAGACCKSALILLRIPRRIRENVRSSLGLRRHGARLKTVYGSVQLFPWLRNDMLSYEKGDSP